MYTADEVTSETFSPCRHAATWDYVSTTDLDGKGLRVLISPAPTLLTILRDALQGGRRGTPARWRKASVSRLRARDARVLAPLSDPTVTSYPSMLEPVNTGASTETFDAVLERLSVAEGGALVHALEKDRDVTPVRAWDGLRRAPDRWLDGYVDALHRCWSEVEPLWRRSFALLEREQSRIETAMEHGVSATQILTRTCTRASVVDQALRLAPSDDRSRQLRVDGRGATVVPMVAGAQAGTLSAPGDYLDWIGYPLPDGWRAFDGSAPPPASLEALIGEQRAAVLRCLAQAQPAGQLARVLSYSPSAITFHVRALEAAGLVSRRREGRQVFVERTARGAALLSLYGLV
jgi:DNA-binding transcriptional ArsR family regulator